MKSIKIAFRNILREKKRTFLLAGAIAFGVLIIILLNGLSQGLVGNIKENFSRLLSGHIFISASEVLPTGYTEEVIRDDKLFSDALMDLNIPYKSISKRSQASGELIFASKTIKRISIYGIDFEHDPDFLKNLNILSGSLDTIDEPNHIIIAEKTAQKLNVQAGEEVLFRTTTTTGQNNVDSFIIDATFKGNEIMDVDTGYGSLASINRILNLNATEFQSYSIMLENFKDMESSTDMLYNYMSERVKVADRFRFDFSDLESLMDFRDEDDDSETSEEDDENPFTRMMEQGMFGGQVDPSRAGEITYVVTNINDMLSIIFSIIDAINFTAFVIFLILILIIMVGITNTFRMVLIERFKEIGTMRAMGMQRPVVLKIFLFEAIFIGLLGTLGGILLGILIGNLFSLISFAEFNFLSLFLYKDHFTYLLPVSGMISTIIIIPILCTIAAFFPSRKASLIDPAKALSTNF